jgi:hypothetical protein
MREGPPQPTTSDADPLALPRKGLKVHCPPSLPLEEQANYRLGNGKKHPPPSTDEEWWA